MALFVLSTGAGSSVALSAPFPRRVLAFYDGAQEGTASSTRIHRYAEMPLNHLGYLVTYHDVRQPLPELHRSDDVVGALSWFTISSPDTKRYLRWLAGAAATGKRVVILGELGGDFWAGDLPAINNVLAPLGLAHSGNAVELTLGTRVVRQSGITPFEGPADPLIPQYPIVRRTSDSVVPWIRLLAPSREQSVESTVVATCPGGGYAATAFDILEEPGIGRARWLLDPFAFFSAALGRGNAPAPDVTTLSGRRIFFSHVDGDGLNNVVALGTKYRILLLRVLSEAIVQRFPDLPLTLSLTTGDLDPSLGGNETPRVLLKDIWGSDNVEASVASSTRPYRWGQFESYDRREEERLIAELSEKRGGKFGRLVRVGQSKPSSAVDVADFGVAPRNYLRKPFQLRDEIRGAVDVASELAGRPIRLFQWSGDALPFEEAIGLTRELGLLNMNGGESRLDGGYPSITGLLPISRPVGAERQIYAVGASEIPITTDWTPLLEALDRLGTTRAMTETPRRLKPMNLHYHLSSLGNRSALLAIQSSLQSAAEVPLAPVSAGRYAEIANDFFAVVISRVADQRWRVEQRGSLQTVRFDQASGSEVDIAKSVGVLGQRRLGDALYVALDPDIEASEIEVRAVGGGQPISLLESRWEVRSLVRHNVGWGFETSGFGTGDFKWENVPPGTYEICAYRLATRLGCASKEPDQSLELTFDAPAQGTSSMHVDIVRRDSMPGAQP